MMGEQTKEPCEFHKWETSPGWGVILGVSKCIVCGVIATEERMAARAVKAAVEEGT